MHFSLVSKMNEFVVAPLYSAFSKMFPETQSMCVELIENRRIWQEHFEDEVERDASTTDEQKKSKRDQFEKRFRGLIDKHFSRTNAFKDAEDPIAKRVLSTPPNSRRGSAVHSSPLTSGRSTPSRKRSILLNNNSPGEECGHNGDSFVCMLSSALKAAKQNGLSPSPRSRVAGERQPPPLRRRRRDLKRRHITNGGVVENALEMMIPKKRKSMRYASIYSLFVSKPGTRVCLSK